MSFEPLTLNIRSLANFQEASAVRPTASRGMERMITIQIVPPKSVAPIMSDADLRVSLIKSYQLSTMKYEPAKIPEQVNTLKRLMGQMSDENAQAFLRNPYVVENLVYFLELNPKKVDLAFQVSKEVDAYSQRNNLGPEFTPALKLGSYIVVEYLRDNGLNNLRADQVRVFLIRRLAQLNTEKARLGPKDKDIKVGERSLLNHTIRYLSGIRPERAGRELENALVRVVSSDLNSSLERNTEEMEEFGQSQGMEIEVLRYVTKSKRAAERRVDPAWLPRGIAPGKHARTDWNILPILGVQEDIGERKHQVYEMAPDPSENSALQGSLMRELMIGGFITEAMLDEMKEAYSLHISTVFPKEILNEISMGEYRSMARALAGGFASDQRIAFGGYMSGGSEVTDKSLAGNLKEIKKNKPNKKRFRLPADLALVEVRNLDINPTGQYSAIHAKNVLDFAFRCHWENRVNPSIALTSLEQYAGKRWGIFMTDLQNLYAKYGITPDSMRYKYGKDWDLYMWQEIDQARAHNPKLQDEFATLVRRTARNIREYKRVTLGKSPLDARFYRHETFATERVKKTRSRQARFINIEPHGAGENRVYLSKAVRANMGLAIGDRINLRVGGKTITVRVDRSRIRDDGSVDGIVSPYFRVSAKLLSEFNIPKGFAVLPVYDKAQREIRLSLPDTATWPVMKITRLRGIYPEARQGDDRLYFGEAAMKRFGVKSGDEIRLKFGKFRRKVIVSESTNGSNDYGVSNNIFTALGIPKNTRLRSRFDAEKREFSLGPNIALYRYVKARQDGTIDIVEANNIFRRLTRQARDFGAFISVVDPNAQNIADLRAGYVIGYVLNSDRTGLVRRRIPIPDVAYDKGVQLKNDSAKLLDTLVEKHIFPPEIKTLSTDKLHFAKMLKENSLEAYHPETLELSFEENAARRELFQLLQKHKKIILKPRFGHASRGIMSVERVGGNYKYVFPNAEKFGEFIEGEVPTLGELLRETEKFRGTRRYLAQEFIEFGRYKVERKDKPTRIRTPEMRLVFHRGINGRINLSGMIGRLTDPKLVYAEFYRRPKRILEQMFPGEVRQRLKEIRKAGFSVFDAMENKLGKQIGEVVVDVGIKADGTPIIIEANSKSVPGSWFRTIKNRDGNYYTSSKPIEYALFLSDMN